MNDDLSQLAARVGKDIETSVSDMEESGMVIVKAPPGAGKTYLLLQLLRRNPARRIAVACFTNAQADDICQRCSTEHPGVKILRFASSGRSPGASGYRVITSGTEIPAGPCVVVANTAKWALSNTPEFDFLFVDEAWQISWSDLLLLRGLAPRIVLIGDPGQIPPVVPIDTERWETAPAAPHRPAPEHFLTQTDDVAAHALPGSRRLPADSVGLVRNFYDFDFGAFAEPGERFIRVEGDSTPTGRAISALGERSISSLLVPTDDSGPPVEVDDEIATVIATMISSILDAGASYSDGPKTRKAPVELRPTDIGIVASHRSMNARIFYRLPAKIRNLIKVDTTERWQGLERKLMIAVHPLSSTLSPSPFDLDTGRLCVMASRHQSGLIIVSRDHVADTLRDHIPTADQPLGRPDTTGRGLDRHQLFWSGLTG